MLFCWLPEFKIAKRVFIIIIIQFHFTLYVLNVLFCYTQATVTALCVSMVTVRGRACLSCSGLYDPVYKHLNTCVCAVHLKLILKSNKCKILKISLTGQQTHVNRQTEVIKIRISEKYAVKSAIDFWDSYIFIFPRGS